MFFWISGWPAANHASRRKPSKKGGLKSSGEDAMSAVGIDAATNLATDSSGPDEISRRLEAPPPSAYVLRLGILLSLRGGFEGYDLFFTRYIPPGLNPSRPLTTTN